MSDDTANLETLRLINAFRRIHDPKARRLIIKVVEAAAEGATLKVDEGPKQDEAGHRARRKAPDTLLN